MGCNENLLIVEDEADWCRIYERAASSLRLGQSIKVANDLEGAERLIDSTKFAVALLDVGLDVSDDHNLDGLHVMRKIRDVGDKTSIVVVTGHGGQDVMPIIRDAMQKYGVYDAIGKSKVGPSDIKRLLEGGLDEYRRETASERIDAPDPIRSTVGPMIWDDVIRAIKFGGSGRDFYDFIDRLFGEYLPLVPPPGVDQAYVDTENKVVYGSYWSRAIAAGLLICFGSEATFDKALKVMSGDARIKSCGNLLPIRQLVSNGVKGAVFMVEGCLRDEFRPG
jgi:ActR/RegA family two-component response regulator